MTCRGLLTRLFNMNWPKTNTPIYEIRTAILKASSGFRYPLLMMPSISNIVSSPLYYCKTLIALYIVSKSS